MIRLLLADDHAIFLAGLERLLRDEDDFEIVATATTTEQAMALVREHRPDVAVLDVEMPAKSGLAVARAVKDEAMATKVVLLTAKLSDSQAVEALQLGVEGVVLKAMAAHQLVQCIRKVHAGGTWIESESTARALTKLRQRSESERQVGGRLTAREVEVLRIAATGAPNREIARRLFISEGTVKMHLHAIYEKLSLTGRVELMAYARRHALDE